MNYRNVMLTCLAAAASNLTGCVREGPGASDLEGPLVQINFSDGANFEIRSTDNRVRSDQQCLIIKGPLPAARSVDLKVIFADRSGMASARVVAEGIQGVRHDPMVSDIVRSFDDTIFRDTIALTFLGLGNDVRTGAFLNFTIDHTFQNGVDLVVIARDSFGNETTLQPLRLVSDLAANCLNDV